MIGSKAPSESDLTILAGMKLRKNSFNWILLAIPSIFPPV